MQENVDFCEKKYGADACIKWKNGNNSQAASMNGVRFSRFFDAETLILLKIDAGVRLIGKKSY